MHLASCEHPLIVFNHALKREISVPCGHCNTCNVNRASDWVARLDSERYSSKYCIFFTLTYSDDFLPVLDEGWSSSAFIPDLLIHRKRDFKKIPEYNYVNNKKVYFNNKKRFITDENNDFQVPLYGTILSEQATKNIMSVHAGAVPYCSVYDLQTFVKRFRSHCYRSAFGTDKGLDEGQKVRYFIAAEYGPTTLRPHYHGLFFFDSDEIANVLFHSFASAWLLGSVEYEPVENSASSYVAKYINSFNRLPRIYQSKMLRPFAVSSRKIPIGLRSFADSAIREVFNTSSPVVPVADKSSGEVSYVPIWRTLENRLFPVIPYNSSVDSLSRFSLLRELAYTYEGKFSLTDYQKEIDGYVSSSRLSSYNEFCYCLAKRVSELLDSNNTSLLYVYLCKIVPFLVSLRHSDFAYIYTCLFESNSVNKLYYVIRRISLLLYEFDISLEDYLVRYDKYWYNKDMYKLQEQYIFEDDFVKSSGSIYLLNIDPVKYAYFRNLQYDKLSSCDIFQLQGFGFTFSKIREIYKDENSRRSFFRNYHVSRSLDYIDMQAVNKKIYTDSLKTRRKNEYLKKHPEFINLY